MEFVTIRELYRNSSKYVDQKVKIGGNDERDGSLDAFLQFAHNGQDVLSLFPKFHSLLNQVALGTG